MDEVVSRLRKHGVEVTVHEPSLYLSLPGLARVEAGGKTFRAKPPAYSRDARNGLEGQARLCRRAPQRDDRGHVRAEGREHRRGGGRTVRGKIVMSEGFASPGLVSQFEELGAIGVIAHQSRRRHPLGHLHHDLGHARSRRPAAQAEHPGRRGQQAGRRRADRDRRQGRRASRSSPRWRKAGSTQKLPVVDIRGTEEPEKFVLPARPSRHLGRRRRRQRHRRRDHAGDRARALGRTATS